MTSTNEKPPEVNPMLKMSIGSVISNPISDDEYLTKGGKKSLYIATSIIIFDIILILLVFLQEYNFLTKEGKNYPLLFSIKSFFTILILAIITVLFWSHKYYFAQIGRFGYLILGTIYYIVKFVLKLVNLIKELTEEEDEDEPEEEDEVGPIDVIFIFVHLFTILPRILAFFLSKKYIEKLSKIRRIHLAAEHESFIEKIASRIENGYTRWSNPNYKANNEKEITLNKKQYFDKKEGKDEDEENDDNEMDKEIKEKILITLDGNKIVDDNSTYNSNFSNKKGYIFDKKDEGLI